MTTKRELEESLKLTDTGKAFMGEEKYTTLDTEQCKWWVITLFGMAKSLACQTNNFDDAEEMQLAQDKIIKALEQQKPMEKFENAKDHIRKLAGDYKCWDNRLSHEESLELYNILEGQPTSDDCVSRQAVLDKKELIELPDGQSFYSIDPEDVEALPPVTPAQCIAAIRFSKEDLREICNERIEIECTHGTCKDCKWLTTDEDGNYYCRQTECFDGLDFYCADFEKRGAENE